MTPIIASYFKMIVPLIVILPDLLRWEYFRSNSFLKALSVRASIAITKYFF